MATVSTRIGPADHGRAMTLEEFREADEEEGYRYELARGVVEVTEVPNNPHGDVVCRLYDAIALYRRTHPDHIARYGGAGEFHLWIPGMISRRNPDLAVVLRTAPNDRRGRRIPSLAAEVVSQGGEARDYETKREEYLRYGLLEYWIVDPQRRIVTVLHRDGDVWTETIVQGDARIPSRVLPGLETTPNALWADVEGDQEVPGA